MFEDRDRYVKYIAAAAQAVFPVPFTVYNVFDLYVAVNGEPLTGWQYDLDEKTIVTQTGLLKDVEVEVFSRVSGILDGSRNFQIRQTQYSSNSPIRSDDLNRDFGEVYAGIIDLRRDYNTLSAGIIDLRRDIVAAANGGTVLTGEFVRDLLADIGLEFPQIDSGVEEGGFINVDDLGAMDDGSNIADILTSANAVVKNFRFSAGKTYHMQNWVPLAGTNIIADGATICRFDDATYGTTGSSAALVIANDDIRIRGGKWNLGPNATKALTFSGSILIESGSFWIEGAELTGTWGAIFGHEVQNGNLTASYVSTNRCHFHNNTHNTYYADIDNFVFTNNRSHDSDRDGLKAYRNVQNLIIVGNHLTDNGNGSPDQSQDGMDLFFGGRTCIIMGNFCLRNDAKGIDIKRADVNATQSVFGEIFIIQGNQVFDNGSVGIETEQNQTIPVLNEKIIINANFFGRNGNRGAFLADGRDYSVTGNHFFDNVGDGLRMSNVHNSAVSANHFTNNDGSGLLITPDCSEISVMGNIAANDGRGLAQTTGIFHAASGVCRANSSYGHATNLASGVTDGTLRGDVIRTNFLSNTATLAGSVSRHGGVVTGMRAALQGAGDVGIQVSKRRANGSNGGVIYSEAAANFVANASKRLIDGDWNTSDAILGENEIILISATHPSDAPILFEIEVIS